MPLATIHNEDINNRCVERKRVERSNSRLRDRVNNSIMITIIEVATIAMTIVMLFQ